MLPYYVLRWCLSYLVYTNKISSSGWGWGFCLLTPVGVWLLEDRFHFSYPSWKGSRRLFSKLQVKKKNILSFIFFLCFITYNFICLEFLLKNNIFSLSEDTTENLHSQCSFTKPGWEAISFFTSSKFY